MNIRLEDLKNSLIDIMKEAIELSENNIETIPGTKIKIKKGRAFEFQSLAYLFYEKYKQENNIFENAVESANYLNKVHDILIEEAEKSLKDEYVTKARDLTEIAKSNNEKLVHLNNVLSDVLKNYDKLVKQAADLQARVNQMEYSVWSSRFAEINASIAELAENRGYLTRALLNTKREMNEDFLKIIDEEMARIRSKFAKHPKIDTPVYGRDGNSILPEDTKNYNNLIELGEIIKNVNENESFISVGGVLCVNEAQAERANELLRDINNLNLLSRPDKKYNTSINKDINNEVIDSIWKELSSLAVAVKEAGKEYATTPNDVTILKENEERYLNLLEILKVLNRAKASDEELVSVWDNVFVLSRDRKDIVDLMRKDQMFNLSNPDAVKKAENEKLITELEAYLVELEQNFINYKNYSNIPSKKTSRDTIVLDADYQEYETICQMILYLKMNNNLSNKRYDLENVWNLGYVSASEVSRYKNLINQSRKYGEKAPKITENEKIIEEIKEKLMALNEKAKNTPNPVLADNKMVLKSDEEEYSLLIEQLKYLEASKDYLNDLVPVGNALIASKYVEHYLDVLNKLEEIKKKNLLDSLKITGGDSEPTKPTTDDKDLPAVDNTPVVEPVLKPVLENPNKLKIEEIKQKIAALAKESISIEEKRTKKLALNALKNILENAVNSEDLIEIDGVKIAKGDEKEYRNVMAVLESLNKRPKDTKDNENSDVKTVNQALIEEFDKQLASLDKENISDEAKRIKKLALNNLKGILKRAADTNDLVEIDGIKIAKSDEEEYRNIVAVLDSLNRATKDEDNSKDKDSSKGKSKKEETKKSKKKGPVKVRKLKKKASEWLKTNKKAVMAIGLISFAVVVGSVILMEPLIYACGALSVTFPAIAPALTGLVDYLCSLGFAQNVGGVILSNSGIPLSANFMASRAVGYLLQALAGAGFITISSKIIKKRFIEDDKKLPKEKAKRCKISEKVLGTLDKLKGIPKAIKNKFDLTKNIGKIKDYEDDDELDFEEIEQEIQEQQEEIEDNIEKRVARITAEADDDPVIASVIGDEEDIDLEDEEDLEEIPEDVEEVSDTVEPASEEELEEVVVVETDKKETPIIVETEEGKAVREAVGARDIERPIGKNGKPLSDECFLSEEDADYLEKLLNEFKEGEELSYIEPSSDEEESLENTSEDVEEVSDTVEPVSEEKTEEEIFKLPEELEDIAKLTSDEEELEEPFEFEEIELDPRAIEGLSEEEIKEFRERLKNSGPVPVPMDREEKLELDSQEEVLEAETPIETLTGTEEFNFDTGNPSFIEESSTSEDLDMATSAILKNIESIQRRLDTEDLSVEVRKGLEEDITNLNGILEAVRGTGRGI